MGGMLVPRMTKVQKMAIGSPANGLLVYQTDDTIGFWYYNQTTWIPVMWSITAGNGLTGGQIYSNGTIDLANTTVAPGTYGNTDSMTTFTVNAMGQLTFAGLIPIADRDSTNELQKLTFSNDTLFLSQDSFVVLNYDRDTLNEIQRLTFSNDTVYLSKDSFFVFPRRTTKTLQMSCSTCLTETIRFF